MLGDHPDYKFNKRIDKIIKEALENEKFLYKSSF
jgi:hypothetical protein